MTSQPLLEPSIVRLYSIPTAGATSTQATREYWNSIYQFFYCFDTIIADLDYMSFNDTISLPAGVTRHDYTIIIILNLEDEAYKEVFSATLEFVSGWPLTFTGSNATITIYDADGNFPFFYIFKIIIIFIFSSYHTILSQLQLHFFTREH